MSCVTNTSATEVQPFGPVVVTVYVPGVEAVVAAVEAVNPPGPVHAYVALGTDEVPSRLVDSSSQSRLLEEAATAPGAATSRSTVAVVVEVQPFSPVTVSV